MEPAGRGSTPPRRIRDSLRFLGPGLILTAGVVGTGELVVTPRVGSEHGFELLWLIVVGCLVKVFVQIELGRYAVATGSTTLSMMNDVPGPRWRVGWLIWLSLPVYVAMISVIGGMLGGTAEILVMAGAGVDTNLLALLIGISLAGLLAAGRYGPVERLSVALVGLFTLATVVAVIFLQFSDFRVTAAHLASGFEFRLPSDFGSVFAAFGLIGVGASELIYYPYWCIEKGYSRWVGPRDEGWLDRARGWLSVMRIDAFAALIVYTIVTIAFYLLGAAVLFGSSLEVSDDRMVETLAEMYLSSIGPLGWWVFVAGAFITLYSTAFAATAANARLLTDAMELIGFRSSGGSGHRERIRSFSIGLPIYGALVYLIWPRPVTLMLISGVGQAALLPFLGGMALYLRYRKLDEALKPGRMWTVALWISAVAMAAIFGWQLISMIG